MRAVLFSQPCWRRWSVALTNRVSVTDWSSRAIRPWMMVAGVGSFRLDSACEYTVEANWITTKKINDEDKKEEDCDDFTLGSSVNFRRAKSALGESRH